MVENGDLICLDAAKRTLNLLISDDEIASRLSQWSPTPSPHLRGYLRLFVDHVFAGPRGV